MDEITTPNDHNSSQQVIARMEEMRQEKEAIIMDLFKTADMIEREDVMAALDCSGSSASHHLHKLVEEGKILHHGNLGPTSHYTKT